MSGVADVPSVAELIERTKAEYDAAVSAARIAVGEAELGRLDQLGVGHPHAVDLAVEIVLPEVEELGQGGELGRQVEVLPDEAL